MKYLRRVKIFLVLALLAFAAFLGWGYARSHPEDMPWTKLDLARPVGAFTGRKLAALGRDGERCRALLRRAGVRFAALPPRGARGQCGYDDAVRLGRGGALDIAYRPADLGRQSTAQWAGGMPLEHPALNPHSEAIRPPV